MIELELPFPPSINNYYRRGYGAVLISRKGRAYRERVCSILAKLNLKSFLGPLKVQLELYLPDNVRRDIDNFQKALFDAMEHARVYGNDSQIVVLETKKCEAVSGGRCIVRLWEIDPRD